MSLSERSRQTMLLQDQATRSQAERKKAACASELKRQVSQIIPPERIASLMQSNPLQARSEIRSACRSVFNDPSWSDISIEAKRQLARGMVDLMFGFGPIESMLEDDSITEIMVNGSRSIYVERHGRLERCSQAFSDDAQVLTLIDRILGPIGRRIDESSPMVNARLPQGYRVNAVIPPLAIDGPMLTIRKFSKDAMSLDDLADNGSFDAPVAQFLRWAVIARKNIAVSGGTGSGKTTLLNALSGEIPPTERIITIEDLAELRFAEHLHVVRLEARPMNAEGKGQVSIRDLVTNALRMRPDRIVVGECRGAEALDMLQAMNTGHDGSLTTLHANAPAEVVSRLTTMVRYAADLPVDVVEAYIASAIDVIVQTARAMDGRRYISAMAEISYEDGLRRSRVVCFYEREFPQDAPLWHSEPSWISRAADLGIIPSEEVRAWESHLFLAA